MLQLSVLFRPVKSRVANTDPYLGDKFILIKLEMVNINITIYEDFTYLFITAT
jgi:hypothetical protein